MPIIFVTGIDLEPSAILRAYAEGAVDFIQKPIEPEILRAKVSVFAELHRARRRLADEQAQRAQREFLARAGEALASSLDYRTTLATVARLAVPELADWCSVDLVEPGAAPSQVAVVHAIRARCSSRATSSSGTPPIRMRGPACPRSFAAASPNSTPRFPRRSSKPARSTPSTFASSRSFDSSRR